MKLISLDALVAEIERMIQEEYPCDNSEQTTGYHCALYELQDFLNTLEVKEVDLELGIKKSVNESIIRKIVDLNEESGKHYDAVIKKEREENGFSQLAIDLFDHKVDINELRIQYIIENLKAQKGE